MDARAVVLFLLLFAVSARAQVTITAGVVGGEIEEYNHYVDILFPTENFYAEDSETYLQIASGHGGGEGHVVLRAMSDTETHVPIRCVFGQNGAGHQLGPASAACAPSTVVDFLVPADGFPHAYVLPLLSNSSAVYIRLRDGEGEDDTFLPQNVGARWGSETHAEFYKKPCLFQLNAGSHGTYIPSATNPVVGFYAVHVSWEMGTALDGTNHFDGTVIFNGPHTTTKSCGDVNESGSPYSAMSGCATVVASVSGGVHGGIAAPKFVWTFEPDFQNLSITPAQTFELCHCQDRIIVPSVTSCIEVHGQPSGFVSPGEFDITWTIPDGAAGSANMLISGFVGDGDIARSVPINEGSFTLEIDQADIGKPYSIFVTSSSQVYATCYGGYTSGAVVAVGTFDDQWIKDIHDPSQLIVGDDAVGELQDTSQAFEIALDGFDEDHGLGDYVPDGLGDGLGVVSLDIQMPGDADDVSVEFDVVPGASQPLAPVFEHLRMTVRLVFIALVTASFVRSSLQTIAEY